jgi:hypothetical protein
MLEFNCRTIAIRGVLQLVVTSTIPALARPGPSGHGRVTPIVAPRGNFGCFYASEI